jgi:hypothetical protein
MTKKLRIIEASSLQKKKLAKLELKNKVKISGRDGGSLRNMLT